ncbi:MAG: sensor histidine kinase [Actinomycetota bacterium]
MTTLVVFIAVAVALWWALAVIIRERTRATAEEHAEFVTHSVIRPALQGIDLRSPLGPGDPGYAELKALVSEDVLGVQFPVVHVSVWDDAGTVLFSDEPSTIGLRMSVTQGLRSAFRGEVVSTVGPPVGPEQRSGSILATFVPVSPSHASSSVTVVVEVDTDVAAASIPVGQPFRLVGVALAGGLSAIYVIQLPLVRRLGRTLREQNERLGALLRQEQRTVEELRELNRRQTEFLSVTSHELRTPLTSIGGYAKTLMQPRFAEDRHARDEFLRSIERQANRLGFMIENILAVTQDDRTMDDEAPAATPDAILSAVMHLGYPPERVETDLPADLPGVRLDSRRLTLVFGNLIDNALKFSPPRSRCRLSAEEIDRDVVVSVEDDGIGIPATERDRIFERFFQVDSSSTRHYGGVGLGLYVVKTIVERAGGRVDVQSEVGHGSRFTVRLPAAPAVPMVGALETRPTVA